MRPLLLIFALFFAALPAHAFETGRLVLEHDGIEREAIVDFTPGTVNAPVLIALHGGLAGPVTVRRRAQVTLANEGWVVVWPYAIDDWNDGRQNARGEPFDTADDIGFLRALVADLARRGVADPEKVYFAGPSIGGVMVLNLICNAPDLVAGAAVAIASFPRDYDCAEGPAKPILYFHGTEDDIMPPDGGRIGGWSPLVRERGRVEPVADTLTRLAARNGCDSVVEERLPERSDQDESSVIRRDYQGCDAPLIHFVIEGGGHTWPGSAKSRLGTSIVGATNQDISATREVEAFFKALAGR